MTTQSHHSDEPIEVIEKLKSFLALREGSHYGQRRPLSREVYNNAKKLTELALMRAFKVYVFGGIEGEVNVCVYRFGYYREFTFKTDNTVNYIIEPEDQDDGSKSLSIGEAFVLFKKIQYKPCPTISWLSTDPVSTEEKNASEAWLSKVQQKVGSHAFRPSVLMEWEPVSVNISESPTHLLRRKIKNRFFDSSPIPVAQLPESCVVEETISITGDVSPRYPSYELIEVPRELIIRTPISESQVCEDGGHRALLLLDMNI